MIRYLLTSLLAIIVTVVVLFMLKRTISKLVLRGFHNLLFKIVTLTLILGVITVAYVGAYVVGYVLL
jgi:hypothetical protein